METEWATFLPFKVAPTSPRPARQPALPVFELCGEIVGCSSATLQPTTMPKARKRKIPVTSALFTPSSSTARSKTNCTLLNPNIDSNTGSANPQASRTIIRRFHVLLKRKAQLQALQKRRHSSTKAGSSSSGGSSGSVEVEKELREVEREMESMGGLGVYQRMSSIGQGKDRGGGSERVLIGWLKGMGWKGVGGVKHRCVCFTPLRSTIILGSRYLLPLSRLVPPRAQTARSRSPQTG